MRSEELFPGVVADAFPVQAAVGNDLPRRRRGIVPCAKRRHLQAVPVPGPASGGPISFGEKKWGKETHRGEDSDLFPPDPLIQTVQGAFPLGYPPRL